MSIIDGLNVKSQRINITANIRRDMIRWETTSSGTIVKRRRPGMKENCSEFGILSNYFQIIASKMK